MALEFLVCMDKKQFHQK
uniref:Uncharacterized protein n=1 Tax=Arundo donax TaxID=35708 RepID=A0A0A9E9X7_ARUDO